MGDRDRPESSTSSAVGDRQIVMTRGFAAPPSLVFDALVTPSLLLQWMHGPAGWRMVECDFDATEGGRYRYLWRGPNGQSMTAKGVVREIIRPTRLVTVELFDDNWTGGEVTAVIELTADWRRDPADEHGHLPVPRRPRRRTRLRHGTRRGSRLHPP